MTRVRGGGVERKMKLSSFLRGSSIIRRDPLPSNSPISVIVAAWIDVRLRCFLITCSGAVVRSESMMASSVRGKDLIPTPGRSRTRCVFSMQCPGRGTTSTRHLLTSYRQLRSKLWPVLLVVKMLNWAVEKDNLLDTGFGVFLSGPNNQFPSDAIKIR